MKMTRAELSLGFTATVGYEHAGSPDPEIVETGLQFEFNRSAARMAMWPRLQSASCQAIRTEVPSGVTPMDGKPTSSIAV
jgi:hypothetical protein